MNIVKVTVSSSENLPLYSDYRVIHILSSFVRYIEDSSEQNKLKRILASSQPSLVLNISDICMALLTFLTCMNLNPYSSC